MSDGMHADAGSSHELNASGKNEPPLDESWLRACGPTHPLPW